MQSIDSAVFNLYFFVHLYLSITQNEGGFSSLY